MNINIKSALLFSLYLIVLQIVKCESLFIYKGQYMGTVLFYSTLNNVVCCVNRSYCSVNYPMPEWKSQIKINYTITRNTGLVLRTTLFVIVEEFPVVKCYVLPHSIGNCFVEIDDIINDFLRDKLVNHLSMTEIIYLLQVVLLLFFF